MVSSVSAKMEEIKPDIEKERLQKLAQVQVQAANSGTEHGASLA